MPQPPRFFNGFAIFGPNRQVCRQWDERYQGRKGQVFGGARFRGTRPTSGDLQILPWSAGDADCHCGTRPPTIWAAARRGDSQRPCRGHPWERPTGKVGWKLARTGLNQTSMQRNTEGKNMWSTNIYMWRSPLLLLPPTPVADVTSVRHKIFLFLRMLGKGQRWNHLPYHAHVMSEISWLLKYGESVWCYLSTTEWCNGAEQEQPRDRISSPRTCKSLVPRDVYGPKWTFTILTRMHQVHEDKLPHLHVYF